MENVLCSIQEPPPAHQVSSIEDSELEGIQNVTNATYSNQESSASYQPLQADSNSVETNQNVADDTYRAQGPPPTYEESVTTFTKSGAI